MSWNTMTLLAQHLARFSPVLILNNSEIAGNPCNLNDGRESDNNGRSLIVLDVSSVISYEALTKPGNYLFLGASVSQVQRTVSNRANVIVIQGDGADIVSSAQAFFEGISLARDISDVVVTALTGESPVEDCLLGYASLIENPVGLWASDMSLVAVSDREIVGEPIWDGMISGLKTPYDYVPDKEMSEFNKVAREYTYPTVVIAPSSDMRHRLMMLTFRAKNHAHYYLYAVESRRQFSERDLPVFFLLTRALATALSGMKVRPTREELLADAVALALGEDSSVRSVAEAATMGISPNEELIVMAMEAISRELSYAMHTTAVRAVRRESARALVSPYGRHVVAIIPMKDMEQGGLPDTIDRLARDGIRIAQCKSPAGIMGARTAYLQCLAALELGRKLHPRERVHRYESYALLDFANKASNSFDVRPWVLPTARGIREYDREHGASLEMTLRAFIGCKDYREVARKLFVHRNTAAYRIQRCVDLFDIDLHDDMFLARLALSFDLLALTE